jgi:hypothetical protein
MARSILGIETGTIYPPLKWVANKGTWSYTEYLWDETAERNDNKPFLPATLTFTAAFEFLETLHVCYPADVEVYSDDFTTPSMKKVPPVRRNVIRAGKGRLPNELPDSGDPKHPFQVAFQVLVKIHGLQKEGTIHEILGTSGILRNAICEVFDEFWHQKDAHPGEAPIIKNTGFKEVRTKEGISIRPVLEIIGWEKWPANLPKETISQLRNEGDNEPHDERPDWANIPDAEPDDRGPEDRFDDDPALVAFNTSK